MAIDTTQTHMDGTARRAVACFDRYEDAEAFVDSLSDRGFAVEHLTVVGRDLRLVEQVTGRLTAARTALTGAGSGALLGAFFGWLFGLWLAPDGLSFLGTILYWAVVGAVIGALFSLITYALSGGRRDFTSASGIRASHFDVLASDPVADEVERLAQDMVPRNAPGSHGAGGAPAGGPTSPGPSPGATTR